MSPKVEDEQAYGGYSVNTCMMPMFGMECFPPGECDGPNHIFVHEHQTFRNEKVRKLCEL